jgi:hypothetical protein
MARKVDGDGREAGAGQVFGEICELVEVAAEVVRQHHGGHRRSWGDLDAMEFADGGREHEGHTDRHQVLTP